MNSQELAELAEHFRGMLRLAVFVSRRLDGSSDLSSTQLSILNMTEGDGLRMGVVAANLGVRVPSATEQVARLERVGLVERRADPSDARAVVVVRTPRGDRAAEEANRVRTARMVTVLETLDADELNALRTALPVMDKINEHLHTLSNPKERLS